MPLAPLDFLASVVTPFLAANLGGLHRLALDTHRIGSSLAAFLGTNLDTKRIDELGPSAVVAPLREVFVHSTLGKQVMREHVPLATGAIEVLDRVDDLPHIDDTRPTAVLARWNQRLQDGPLCVGQVGRIGFAYWRVHVQTPWFGE